MSTFETDRGLLGFNILLLRYGFSKTALPSNNLISALLTIYSPFLKLRVNIGFIDSL